MKAAVASLLFLSDIALSGSSPWDYEHMDDWSHGFSMCGLKDQSPIDIKRYESIFNPQVCDSTFDWDVDFTKQTFKVNNNGHSITLKPVKEANYDPDHDLDGSLTGQGGTDYVTLTENENTIARFPNYFKPKSSEHDEWCLDSLHFHWGATDATGSEHLVDGHQFPLELHFVHYSCAHASLGSTLSQFPDLESVASAAADGVDTHQLGVVGILFDVVDENNPAFDALFTNDSLLNIELPLHNAHADIDIVENLDLSQIIPSDIATAGYYAYEGSLTTPPCTNIVRWHVMNARATIGKSQMEVFRTLMSTEEHALAPNYRVVQEENPNKVYSCMAGNVEVDSDSSSVDGDMKGEELSWWAVAIIASLATAAVMGLVFFFVYKKQETEVRRRLHTNSFDGSAKRKLDAV